jgi:hypothetical protein
MVFYATFNNISIISFNLKQWQSPARRAEHIVGQATFNASLFRVSVSRRGEILLKVALNTIPPR